MWLSEWVDIPVLEYSFTFSLFHDINAANCDGWEWDFRDTNSCWAEAYYNWIEVVFCVNIIDEISRETNGGQES